MSGERWTEAIEEIASFSSRERPEEVRLSYNQPSFEMFRIQFDFCEPWLDRHDAFKMHPEVLFSIMMRRVEFFL